ncbi:MAG: TIGR03545 family protein, partial [Sulfurimonadaceae bacterium]|nr:TIGR03545 family protein [Sulfurimonadaceae bacterium]
MKFILKLFKALNSAQTPWQVTLAIALGMVAGLTPVSGIQTVLILFLAFLLNIHLGLFFVASAFFAGIGYLFDPWFEQIGYALLNSEGLRGLWTAWYNSGVMRMSHFNNTLVMGSTVVALVLAVPLYFLLGWLIDHYRDALSVVLEKYPRLGLFGILQASQTKDPLLRWWGAGLFVGVGAGVVAIALLVVDPLAKWALEAGGSTALQRDVRVGSVDISLVEGSVTIDRIEIAGEKEGIDALSVETAAFDIALNALLMNRTHIETVAMKGMGFDTPATLKKDPAPPSDEESATTSGTGMELPAFELPTPESVLENADLQSLKVYNEADAEIKAIMDKWQKVSDTDLSGAALDDLKKEFAALKEMSGSKDPAQLLALQKKVSEFNKKVKSEQQRLSALQDEFNADQKRIEALYDKVLKAPMEDYNKLKSVYTLDGSGAMNVVSLLMGDKIKEYLAMAKRYYAMVEPYLQSEPKPPVTPRGEGRWLKYPLTVPSPDLLIANTEIDGVLNKQAFSATFSDITDNQKALGRPLQFEATSDGPQI